METPRIDTLVRQLCAGFDALQDEYQKLHSHSQSLERKLATAREQYNELAKLCGSKQTTTPPLSLSSTPSPQKLEELSSIPVSAILDRSSESHSREAADIIKAAEIATKALHHGLPPTPTSPSHGVRIWSGPSADRQEVAVSSVMPSISESPLEQDFTVEGKPSRLGCPFASMANKKLSSHAASVLSRYNQSGSVCAASTQASSASRVNGRDSMARRYSHRRESFLDPIKAEICGLSDHEEKAREEMPALTKKQSADTDNAEPGVCPIRFLDQHSPEEVATYFENHKHELPRSHEVCVKRYQSNEEQIRQLDAKYGNLVSMIQGLGKKHQDFLPEEPQDEDEEEGDGAVEPNEAASNEKVRKWARSVSAQAADGHIDDDEEDDDAHPEAADDDEDRQPHFERPLRDIRVGESPSRPWGIQVPAKYLEKEESVTSSKPVEVTPPRAQAPAPDLSFTQSPHPGMKVSGGGGKCPFAHGAAAGVAMPNREDGGAKAPAVPPSAREEPAAREAEEVRQERTTPVPSARKESQVVITGPVFIGYSAEDAIRILRESGLKMGQA